MFQIAPHSRLRRSVYFDATVAAGVKSFTPYNQMLLPMSYGDPEAEYWRLINGVSQWDVACERQIQIKGPDAARLAQILTPRDLSSIVQGQGKYVALCNHAGTIINDPVLLKIDDDCYWFSIADSNILFWARAIACERRLNVEVSEPDVSPMAIQGPKAEAVVAALLGDWIKQLKYFWFKETRIDNIPLIVARSGWSKQGGFELYLMDGAQGIKLWNIAREAGKPWGIGPGAPTPAERIESGLLSWGGDTDDMTNPFEIRMRRYIDLDIDDEVIGVKALRDIDSAGVRRHQLGVILDEETPTEGHGVWHDIYKGENKIGDMTNGVWSWRLKRNIGFALVSCDSAPGDIVSVHKRGKLINAKLTSLPFC